MACVASPRCRFAFPSAATRRRASVRVAARVGWRDDAVSRATTGGPADVIPFAATARHLSRGGPRGARRASRASTRLAAVRHVSPFATDDDPREDADVADDASASSALERAQRALRFRHRGSRREDADAGAAPTGGGESPPLDVYTEALLAACGGDGCGGVDRSRTGVEAEEDEEDAAAEAGWSNADVSSILDHLAFDRLQVIMENAEVSKGVEVMGTMRQVVVVGTGLDARGFRIPWPRGTAVFQLAHEDVHRFAAATLKAVGAKPPRGCSHRRVPCDPTAPESCAYGDLEEAMLRAGYGPDVPSVWVVQDVSALGGGDQVTRWRDLVEEIADLMCAGSEIVGHVPDARAWGIRGAGDGSAFGAPLAQDMAVAGVLARSFKTGNLLGRGESVKGQLGVFHGIKQRPSKQEAEYYREQIYMAEFEQGDEDGFED